MQFVPPSDIRRPAGERNAPSARRDPRPYRLTDRGRAEPRRRARRGTALERKRRPARRRQDAPGRRGAPAEDITDRIVRRIAHLRETRLRPDGTRHSYDEIAASYGASRASLSNLVNSRRKTPSPQMPSRQPLSQRTVERRPARSGGPLASTQAGIETFFFGQPNGWLSADPQASLNHALQPILHGLEGQAADPMARLRSTHGLRELAARAPQLAEEELQLVTDWIDTILQRRNAQRVQGSGSDSAHTEGH